MKNYLARLTKRALLLFYRVRYKQSVHSLLNPKILCKDFVSINSGCTIASDCSILSYVYIGRNCTANYTLFSQYCSVGNNVSIGLGHHNLNRLSLSSLFYDNPYHEHVTKQTVLKPDCWIGSNSIIMQGVTIGIGAVVGAGAVVTKDVDDFSIVAGVPAKFIRYRLGSETRDKLIKSKWWSESPIIAQKIFKTILD